MKTKFNTKILLSVLCLMILDLIIKAWTLNTLGFLNERKLIDDVFSIIPVKNIKVALNFRNGWTVIEIAEILFKLLFLILFVRIQIREVAKGFKWASALIIFGWLGNLIDRLVFAEETDHGTYMHMDYFYDGLLTGAVTSITTIMILTGWLFLLIVAVVKFRDLKKIFAKTTANTLPVI